MYLVKLTNIHTNRYEYTEAINRVAGVIEIRMICSYLTSKGLEEGIDFDIDVYERKEQDAI